MQDNGHSSVLFSDIRDFTEFTASQGDEQALRLSQLHREFAVQTLNQLGYGKLIKTYGDGVMLQFESASQAVEAAMRLSNVDDASVVRFKRTFTFAEMLFSQAQAKVQIETGLEAALPKLEPTRMYYLMPNLGD